MNKEDFELSKNELMDEYDLNNEKIENINYRLNTIISNGFEVKTISIFIYSCLGNVIMTYFCVLGVFNIISTNLVPAFLAISSSVIGGLVVKVILKLVNGKEKAVNFFNPVSWFNKKLEEAIYKLEKEKLLSRNIIIEKALGSLEKTEKAFEFLSDKYNIVEVNDKQLSKEELEKNVDDIEKLLLKEYEKLDILITEKFLNDNFLLESNKKKVGLAAIYGGLGAFMAAFHWSIPIVTMNFGLASSINISSLNIIFPFICGLIIPNIYLSKLSSVKKRVFELLNGELENKGIILDDFLSEDYEKCKENICDLKLEIQKKKRKIIENTELLKKEDEDINEQCYLYSYVFNKDECVDVELEEVDIEVNFLKLVRKK